jgi:hypothetical protein
MYNPASVTRSTQLLSAPCMARSKPQPAQQKRDLTAGAQSASVSAAVALAVDVLPQQHPAARMVRRASAGQLMVTEQLTLAAEAQPPPRIKCVSWRDDQAGHKLCSSLHFVRFDPPRACSKDKDVRAAYASPCVLAPTTSGATGTSQAASSYGRSGRMRLCCIFPNFFFLSQKGLIFFNLLSHMPSLLSTRPGTDTAAALVDGL